MQQLTLQEVLESYKHIELTEDEVSEALILAKQKKEKLIAQDRIREREKLNRMKFTQKTNYDLVNGLMRLRMEKIFEKPFVLDDDNTYLYELLCYYFGEDIRFVDYALAVGVSNPSLQKGILLAGNFGTGKTWMMKLFCKNQRQCFSIHNAKEIAAIYKNAGEEGVSQFLKKTKAAFEDPSVFHQKFIGLYIDDIGTEDLKSNYGDKKNVIGDIIEIRCNEQNAGVMLHGSTNLTAPQLNEYYGGRVVSRMRENFNFIEVIGSDRRK